MIDEKIHRYEIYGIKPRIISTEPETILGTIDSEMLVNDELYKTVSDLIPETITHLNMVKINDKPLIAKLDIYIIFITMLETVILRRNCTLKELSNILNVDVNKVVKTVNDGFIQRHENQVDDLTVIPHYAILPIVERMNISNDFRKKIIKSIFTTKECEPFLTRLSNIFKLLKQKIKGLK